MARAWCPTSAPGEAEKLIARRPELIFHLAAVVSGEAEADFDKGYRVNLDGTRELFEAIRKANYTRVVFTFFYRRIRRAVPGSHRRRIPERAAHELRHAEGHRRAAALRLQPPRLLRRHRAAPADDLRAPRQAEQGCLGVFLRHHSRAARRAGGRAARTGDGAPLVRPAARRSVSCCTRQARHGEVKARRNLSMPGVSATVGEQIEALRKVAGEKLPASFGASPTRRSCASSKAGRATSIRGARLLGFRATRGLRGHYPDSAQDVVCAPHLSQVAVNFIGGRLFSTWRP